MSIFKQTIGEETKQNSEYTESWRLIKYLLRQTKEYLYKLYWSSRIRETLRITSYGTKKKTDY